ncbi:Serine/Threonine kinase catalytic domain protein [Rhizoctonia solani 123E]|uniref:non-specific serine/threonine protein kinase n=1 Tax=Rhizoctonia solani 123E TaxID=1423351 RepID=A0A074SD33_9AGAM|nr:Serine/Threonine kinase catalytic domain protein [Rhizoctonia solani 123E]
MSMSTGSKRPLPADYDSPLPYGSDGESKRRREEDRRRERDDDRRRDRDRERERDRTRDRRGGRERDRHRDSRRRESVDHRRKSRERGRDRSRDYRSRSRDYRSRSRKPTPTPATAPKDLEREEGEVSPPKTNAVLPSPPPQDAPKPEEPVEELEIPASPPPLEDIIAQRRARREAILAKHAAVSAAPTQPASPALSVGGLTLNGGGSSGTGAPSTPLPNPIPAHVVQNGRSVTGTPEPGATKGTSAASENGQATPSDKGGTFSLTKINNETSTTNEEGTSAAEYDPTLDWREDQARRAAHQTQAEIADGIGERGAVADDKMQVDDEDDDLDDMFAVGSRKIKLTAPKTNAPAPVITAPALNMEADDPEGYYQIILGELLDNGKYQVFSVLGKGMFSAVVRARVMDDPTGREVAIKIIRSQESMYKAGQKEIQILNKLAQADPEDKKHVIRLESTFEHRGHLCIVFESLSMNLRDVIKKFGKDVGLNIRAVRAYAHQLFLALSLLKKANIMHADIKPDNILVNDTKTVVKLCDLGSASDISENDITPYLVSRFYRAPEIILGLPYDASIDIWSIGCTLYELYTGKILFPGRTNNQMLLHMMELKGRFNTKMVRKAKFGDIHFDESAGVFLSAEQDRITGANVVKRVTVAKPAKDVRARVLAAGGKMSDEENKLTLAFVDLIDKCLMLDPSRRITPKEALMHPFVRN